MFMMFSIYLKYFKSSLERKKFNIWPPELTMWHNPTLTKLLVLTTRVLQRNRINCVCVCARVGVRVRVCVQVQRDLLQRIGWYYGKLTMLRGVAEWHT